MITFLAPPRSMWTRALVASVKRPVDSTTMSTPRSFHGSSPGSLMLRNFRLRPSTWIVSSFDETACGSTPKLVSYFSRWANVCASPRSLTATKSMSASSFSAARKMLRPMRPNPLIPTFTAMLAAAPLIQQSRTAYMLGGAASRVGGLMDLPTQLLKPSQTMVYCRLREPHPGGQLHQAQLRVRRPPLRHLAQGRGQGLDPAGGFQPLDRGRLAQAGTDRLADVGGLEVQAPVDLAAHGPHDAHVLELHDGPAGAHQ